MAEQDLDKGPWTENIPAPSRNKYIQDRINKVAGKTSDGRPVLRIEWGQEEMEFTCGEDRAKYLYASALVPDKFNYTDLESGEFKSIPWDKAPEEITPAKNPSMFSYFRYDVGVPRFFVAEHQPRATYVPDWEANRYHTEETGELIDVLGPCPENFYIPLFCVAEHDTCCNGRGVKYTPSPEACFGKFRFPNDSDVQRIQRMLQLREAAHQHRRPEETRISQAEAGEIAKYAYDKKEHSFEAMKARMQERNDAWFKLHGWRLGEFDPTVQHWGSKHFMGKHSHGGGPSNIIIP
jgi:hypothetical protein